VFSCPSLRYQNEGMAELYKSLLPLMESTNLMMASAYRSLTSMTLTTYMAL